MLRRNSDQAVLGLRRAQGQELILGHTCPVERWEGRHSPSPLSAPECDCEGQGTKGVGMATRRGRNIQNSKVPRGNFNFRLKARKFFLKQ